MRRLKSGCQDAVVVSATGRWVAAVSAACDGAMVAEARTTWLLDEVVDKTVAFITVVAAAATNAKGR